MKLKTTTIYNIILFMLIVGGIVWLAVTQIEEFTLQSDPKLKVLKEKIEPLFSSDKKYYGILEPLNNRKNILNEIGDKIKKCNEIQGVPIKSRK